MLAKIAKLYHDAEGEAILTSSAYVYNNAGQSSQRNTGRSLVPSNHSGPILFTLSNLVYTRNMFHTKIQILNNRGDSRHVANPLEDWGAVSESHGHGLVERMEKRLKRTKIVPPKYRLTSPLTNSTIRTRMSGWLPTDQQSQCVQLFAPTW